MSNYSVYVNYSTLPKMVLHIDSESSLISKYVYYRGQADPPVSEGWKPLPHIECRIGWFISI